jgi:hypothetical protein
MTNEIAIPRDLLTQLRRNMPRRALTYGEALIIAGRQATMLRTLLNVKSAAMPLGWVVSLPGLRLDVVPAYKLSDGTSGLTTRLKGGAYVIAVNKNRSHTHRRWTLCHELKHLIDFPYAETTYARLPGNGVERVCDDFAANLLIPKALIIKAWTNGLQDVPALAGLFQVSDEAMGIRLRNLGLLEDESRPIATYFRRTLLETNSAAA